MKKAILLFICFCYGSLCASSAQDVVQSLLNNYTRPVTVLEITDRARPLSACIAQKHSRSVFVVLSMPYGERVPENSADNLVILRPHVMPNSAFEIFARCEHFDVVLINGRQICSRENNFDALLKLGDHCFMQAPARITALDERNPESIIENDSGYLYYFDRPKAGLDIARWNLHHQGSSDYSRYGVESTFSEKYLVKHGKKTAWIPGINLLTFVMLGGACPDNKQVINELKRFKYAEHNDLVIGNFVVQGQRLKAIDFNDAGRRVRSKKSVQAAIRLFKESQRYTEPQQALNRYQKKLNKSLKHS